MAKVKIMAGINRRQWQAARAGIRNITKIILKEFQTLGAKQVNWRLNESVRHKRPVFIDWLAVKEINDKLAAKSGVRDYGVYRFLDPVPSKVYNEALDKAGKEIIVRDWKCELLLKEKRVESRLLVQKAGLMHQRFIGIIAKQAGMRRCVGTLTVSFESRPEEKSKKQVDEKMKEWASWDPWAKSKLVEFIERQFVLGGPNV